MTTERGGRCETRLGQSGRPRVGNSRSAQEAEVVRCDSARNAHQTKCRSGSTPTSCVEVGREVPSADLRSVLVRTAVRTKP